MAVKVEPSILLRKRLLCTLACLALLIGLPAVMAYQLWQMDRHEHTLLEAVRWGNEAEVQRELKWGVDPNTRAFPETTLSWQEALGKWLWHETLPNRRQATPALLLAGHGPVARLLLQYGADPNLTDASNKHALIDAIDAHDAATSLCLLAKGADPNTPDKERTTSALLLALAAANETSSMEDVGRDLIVRGANVGVRDKDGNTSLMYTYANVPLTALLLDKGLAVNAVNNNGQTSLTYASADVTKALLEHGADPNIIAKNGYTALEYTCNNNVAYLEKFRFVEKVKLLLKYGANCDPAQNNGWNVIFWCLQHDKPDLIRAAIPRHLVVNARTRFQRTALMLAAVYSSKSVAPLLAHGAEVNARDSTGMTALMYAAQEDNAEAVQELLRYGSDPLLKDKEQGLTALERAERYDCEDVIALFRTGHVPAKMTGDSASGPIQVDADHKLTCTLLPRKSRPIQNILQDPYGASSQSTKDYRLDLIQKTGHEKIFSKIISINEGIKDPPQIVAFQDMDGQHYVYIQHWRSTAYPSGGICVVKEGRLFRKWIIEKEYYLLVVHHGMAVCYFDRFPTAGRFTAGKVHAQMTEWFPSRVFGMANPKNWALSIRPAGKRAPYNTSDHSPSIPSSQIGKALSDFFGGAAVFTQYGGNVAIHP